MAAVLARLVHRGIALWMAPDGRMMLRDERALHVRAHGRETKRRHEQPRHASGNAPAKMKAKEKPPAHAPLHSPTVAHSPSAAHSLKPAEGAAACGKVQRLGTAIRDTFFPDERKHSGSGEAKVYRGITHADMPGKDGITRRMNFSLFRRGRLRGYGTCAHLHGEALKAEFARINAGQKAKSLLASEQRTRASMHTRK